MPLTPSLAALSEEERKQLSPVQVDQAVGIDQGQALFGNQGQLANTSQDILKRRMDLANGLQAKELAAIRGQAQQQIRGQTQSDLRRLQAIQGRQGVKGGLAAAQQRATLQQGAQNQTNLERDLIMQNIEARRQGLGDLSSDVNKRLFGIQATQSGQAQLGLQQRGLEQGLAIASQPTPMQKPGVLGQIGEEVTIICTELKRQGILKGEVLKADEEYGALTLMNEPEVYFGYIIAASPVVRAMKKSKLITQCVAALALPWAHQMAFEMGYDYKPSLLGRMINFIGKPICRVVYKVHQMRAAYGRI